MLNGKNKKVFAALFPLEFRDPHMLRVDTENQIT